MILTLEAVPYFMVALSRTVGKGWRAVNDPRPLGLRSPTVPLLVGAVAQLCDARTRAGLFGGQFHGAKGAAETQVGGPGGRQPEADHWTGPCDDGSVCTLGDACSGGTCKPGSRVACSDGNLCTNDDCDAKVGCGHVNLPDNATCTDGIQVNTDNLGSPTEGGPGVLYTLRHVSG